ncbi:MAG: efflux transporter outer membrane subunit [Deltaproteobacteria bacterium]|nr:efflux transporter outer membrane subunit [Deltaproteobacteria bacterium]
MANLGKTIVGALLALTWGLSGCALTTDYARPALNLPATWQGAGQASGEAPASTAPATAGPDALTEDEVRALAAGALGFHNPELERLLLAALAKNNNLAAAAWKVRQARLTAGLKADALWPQLGATVSGDYRRDLHDAENDSSHAASGTLNYEVDLWGKLAKTRDLATWEAEATDQDRRAAALALVCTTAELYFQIGYLNESLVLGEASISRAAKSLELARLRHRAGADSSLEVQEALRSLASQEAAQEDLRRQLASQRTALAVLFDAPPEGEVADPRNLPQGSLPQVAEGLPAELLGRRPDLQAAEWRLRASLGNVDVQRVSYYPTLTLTGALGSTSSALLQVINHPVASLVAGLSLPFLQWNEMQLNNELAQAQYEQAVVEFRQTLYEALKEVEDALSAGQYYTAQGQKLAEALRAARTVEGIYETRYKSGLDSMQVWLDAQEKRQTAETSLLTNSLNRYLNYLVLYQALGGEPKATPTSS